MLNLFSFGGRVYLFFNQIALALRSRKWVESPVVKLISLKGTCKAATDSKGSICPNR
ncbi:hypothetical protein SJ05684_c09580 [Sinorhizobium sojae CCBAU 05684]|uniref:Uncharacterized protein n=1 Tax=Sinorhizobium sojae CCBAU 05684 TaxID=716928 RepID=A0A249P9P0_9HYPH|nr:hypothetical protein SJ05684_c09580 [Sinorhizobium sojae CCBAU 05684]